MWWDGIFRFLISAAFLAFIVPFPSFYPQFRQQPKSSVPWFSEWVVTAIMWESFLYFWISPLKSDLKKNLFNKKEELKGNDNERVASITKKGPWALPAPSNTPALGQGQTGEPSDRIDNRIAEDTHASVFQVCLQEFPWARMMLPPLRRNGDMACLS